MRKTITTIFCALSVLLCAVSCQKENGMEEPAKDDTIKIKIGEVEETKSAPGVKTEELLFSMPIATEEGETLVLQAFISEMPDAFQSEAALTKGAVVTTENLSSLYGSFTTSVFKNGVQYTDDQGKSMSSVTVSRSTGEWALVGEPYHWPVDDTEIIFCSSAPIGDARVSGINWNGGSTLSFNYNDTPAGAGNDAKNQKDLIFGINAQKESDHAQYAWINFSHALVGVKFIKGDIDNCTVKSIALSNFKSAGTATGTPGNNKVAFAWSNQSTLKTYSQTFNKTVTGLDDKASLDPTTDGSCTFMMMPQVLDASATLKVVVDDSGTEHVILVNLGSITAEQAGNATNAGKLKDWSSYAGQIITFRISRGKTFTFEVTPNEGVDLSKFDYAGGEGDFTVKSYMTQHTQGDDEYKPVSWTMDYSTDDGANWTSNKPAMLKTVSAQSGLGGATGEVVDYYVKLQTLEFDPESIELAVQSMRAETIGSPSNYVDVRTLPDNGQTQQTANCYLVGHPGYYKLPLAYGNAIKADGSVNIQRVTDYDYGSGVPNGTYYPDPVDHMDQKIENGYIYERYTPYDCVLVWQDEKRVVKNVHLSSDKHFLEFEVDEDYIMQANAVVAVRDQNGTIMWSWHIWVTNRRIADNNYPINCTSQGVNYNRTLLGYPIGWCEGKTCYYGRTERHILVRFTQNETNETKIFTLNQLCHNYSYDDNCVFFQCGRISPEPPAVGLRVNKDKDNWPDIPEYRFRLADTKGPTIGQGIQHPHLHYPLISNDDLHWNREKWTAQWGQSNDNHPLVYTPKTIYDPNPVGYMTPCPEIFTSYREKTKKFMEHQTDDQVISWQEDKILLKDAYGNYSIIYPTGQRDPETGQVIKTAVEGRIWASGAYYGSLGFNGYFNNEAFISGHPFEGTEAPFGKGWNCTAQGLYMLPMKEE